MSLKYGLLGLLNHNSMTGYDLDKVFKLSLNHFWQAQTSQIYQELIAMEKSGWLVSEIIFQSDKPNKKLYTITHEGKSRLFHWLSEPGYNDTAHNHFLLKLAFLGEVPKKQAIEFLLNFKNLHEKKYQMTKIIHENIGENTKGASEQTSACWELTADFGMEYMKMCMNWADGAIKKLEDINE